MTYYEFYKNGFWGWVQKFCLLVFLLGLAAFFVGLVVGGFVMMFFSGCVYVLCQSHIRWLEKKAIEKEWEEKRKELGDRWWEK